MNELQGMDFGLLKVEINKKQEQTVRGRALHQFLQIDTKYNDWMKRMIEYGFKENEDFNLLKIEQVQIEGNRRVKRMIVDHELTFDMAKELCMIQRTELGRQARQYFIQVEKNYKQLLKENNKRYIARQVSIEIRKNMTDAIKEVIPESQHKKFAYPNYTNLVYKIIFNKSAKQIKRDFQIPDNANIRDYLPKEDLVKVEMLEGLIKTYLYAGLQYEQIKNVLYSTFPNGVQVVQAFINKKDNATRLIA